MTPDILILSLLFFFFFPLIRFRSPGAHLSSGHPLTYRLRCSGDLSMGVKVWRAEGNIEGATGKTKTLA